MNHWEVSAQESGITLLAFLKMKFGDSVSARSLKRSLENNEFQVNGLTQRFGTTLLGSGDQVIFLGNSISKIVRSPIHFEKTRLLYEDDALFIYDKPPAIASDSPELLNALKRSLPTLILVHRLDRDTSGILIFAKTKPVFEKFVALFKQQSVDKTYVALVDGVPKKRSGIIDNFLGALHRYHGQAIYGAVPSTKGLRAITVWKCEKAGKEAALLVCHPKTGRTHQIRVHCSEMGHPILGDYQYGRKFRCPYRPERCLLHAKSIAFPHPVTGLKLEITAPLPEDFSNAMKDLRCN